MSVMSARVKGLWTADICNRGTTIGGASERRAIACRSFRAAPSTCAVRWSIVVTTGRASVSATNGGSPSPAAMIGCVAARRVELR